MRPGTIDSTSGTGRTSKAGSKAATVSKGRRPLDAYETPPHYIACLLSEVAFFGRIIEPCVGTGCISDRLRQLPSVRAVWTNDIDRKVKADTHIDAREIDAVKHYDWAVTNPPFACAQEIIEQAFEYAKNLAFLTRLSFLEPTNDREYFWQAHRPTQLIILPRYSFRLNDEGKKQTDNVTCCWIVWHEDGAPRGIVTFGRARARALEHMFYE